MNEPLNVIGHETMSSAIKDAHNYHNWLCSMIMPHLAGSVLEIGPGYGQYTRIFATRAQKMYAADIDKTCIEHLKRTMPDVTSFVDNCDSDAWGESLGGMKFDAIILLNVLEHIKEDGAALARIRSNLAPSAGGGGGLMLIVPAHHTLYGKMDSMAGHYRRYDKKGLHTLLIGSGYRVEEMRYINPIGGIGWFLNALFYKPATLSDDAVNFQIIFFDRYILPLSKLLTPVFGNFFWTIPLVSCC